MDSQTQSLILPVHAKTDIIKLVPKCKATEARQYLFKQIFFFWLNSLCVPFLLISLKCLQHFLCVKSTFLRSFCKICNMLLFSFVIFFSFSGYLVNGSFVLLCLSLPSPISSSHTLILQVLWYLRHRLMKQAGSVWWVRVALSPEWMAWLLLKQLNFCGL